MSGAAPEAAEGGGLTPWRWAGVIAAACAARAEGFGVGGGFMDAVLNSIVALLALVIFDLLALGWGVNSRDGRRETWW